MSTGTGPLLVTADILNEALRATGMSVHTPAGLPFTPTGGDAIMLALKQQAEQPVEAQPMVPTGTLWSNPILTPDEQKVVEGYRSLLEAMPIPVEYAEVVYVAVPVDRRLLDAIGPEAKEAILKDLGRMALDVVAQHLGAASSSPQDGPSGPETPPGVSESGEPSCGRCGASYGSVAAHAAETGHYPPGPGRDRG